jgi:hypothetical protein
MSESGNTNSNRDDKLIVKEQSGYYESTERYELFLFATKICILSGMDLLKVYPIRLSKYSLPLTENMTFFH